MLPPAIENSPVDVTYLHGTPVRKIKNSIAEADDYISRVKPQTLVQCFERAFLRAPKQSQKPPAVDARGARNERLLFGCKIIGQKGVAMRLDHFQIATQLYAEHCHRTGRYTSAVAE